MLPSGVLAIHQQAALAVIGSGHQTHGVMNMAGIYGWSAAAMATVICCSIIVRLASSR